MSAVSILLIAVWLVSAVLVIAMCRASARSDALTRSSRRRESARAWVSSSRSSDELEERGRRPVPLGRRPGAARGTPLPAVPSEARGYAPMSPRLNPRSDYLVQLLRQSERQEAKTAAEPRKRFDDRPGKASDRRPARASNVTRVARRTGMPGPTFSPQLEPRRQPRGRRSMTPPNPPPAIDVPASYSSVPIDGITRRIGSVGADSSAGTGRPKWRRTRMHWV
jgi:hypothetical protein